MKMHLQFEQIFNSCTTCCLTLVEHNASASIQFLKTCDECLVWSMVALVPGYDPLTYLLVYSKQGPDVIRQWCCSSLYRTVVSPIVLPNCGGKRHNPALCQGVGCQENLTHLTYH